MRRITRTLTQLTLLSVMTATLTVVSTGTASAAESIPTLQYPAVDVGRRDAPLVESPTGSVTLPCTTLDTGQDLKTYDAAGQLIRSLDRTSIIDGVPNCISDPVVDTNDNLYGIPGGFVNGYYTNGPNLLAYDGNTLKWKYPLGCGSSQGPSYAVGVNGNIYSTTWLSDGAHLIGLAPELEPGQTQPTKVLDLKIANDCSTELFPYKDGVLLRGQSSGFKYYSYGGKLLTQPAVNSFWYSKLNADGKLFDFKYVSGSYTSASVSMFDPLTGQVAWTTSASTPGANVNGIQVYPLASGGVAALIKEQKMNGGIPVTPTVYHETFVTINSAGTITNAIHFDNSYSQDNVTGTFGGTFVSAESDGKVAVVRELNLNTGISWPQTVPAIAIGVYDPATESWGYQTVMQGDLGQSGGLNGYYLDYAHFAHAMAITNDTLSFLARCSGNCPTASPTNSSKLYAVEVSGLGVEHPRGSVLTATMPPQPTPVSYVALGDSFSSGQGASTYDQYTTIPTNKCYQSLSAYGRVSNRDPYSPLSLGTFAACGGAITDNIDQTATYPDVSKQNAALSSTTQVVTITIGGNDTKFEGVVKGCLAQQCDAAIQDARQELIGLPAKLRRVYNDILNKTASSNGGSNAQVYVFGYGPLLSSDAPDCIIGDAPFGGENRTKAITLLNDLNQVISDAVDAVSGPNPRIHYLNPTGAGSPFIGHSLCTSDPYFNGITVPNTSESFHPNVKGQKAYADMLANELNVNSGDPGGF